MSASVPRVCAGQALRLSLSDALARASLHAPEAVLAGEQTRQVQARRAGAGIILPVNPRLQVEARPMLSDDPFGSLGYAATIDSTFDLGGAPSARVREVERDVEAASAQQNVEAVTARVRAMTAYVSAQLAVLRADEARAGIDLAQRVLSAAEKRMEAGAGSEFERASAQVELARSQAAQEGALREHDAWLMQLRDALDLAAGRALELTTPIALPTHLATLETYLQRAAQQHPELVAERTRLRALAARAERLERELFPHLGVFAGVDAAPRSAVFGIVGVSGELPVAQRKQGPRAVVARERETARIRLSLQEQRIAREITAAWRAYEHRRTEYTLLSESGLPAAERSFELAEAGWHAGRFDWFRVALAARDLMEVRSQRIDALSALWAERTALARATGGELP